MCGKQDKCIFIVEDELILGEIMKDTFIDLGYKVILAKTGQEFRTGIQQELPDVIIMDMKLPDATGLELIPFAKKIHPQVPIIMHTAMDQYRNMPEVKNNVAHYLVKPVQLDQFKMLLGEVFEKYKADGIGKISVWDFILPETINADLKGSTKEEVIGELVNMLYQQKAIEDPKLVTKLLIDRENLSSTAVGKGVALPHVRLKAFPKIIGALGVSKKGVEFGALDKEKVHIIFLVIASDGEEGTKLKYSAVVEICRIVKEKNLCEELKKANSLEVIRDILNRA